MLKPTHVTIAFLIGIGSILFLNCGDLNDIPEKPCQQRGKMGCPCLSGELCLPLDDGTQLVCIEDMCTIPNCEDDNTKATGCLCSGIEQCDVDLLCLNGKCTEDWGQTITPPENPKCYTPCKGGNKIASDGMYLECSDEGLLPGCIDDNVCMDGSCIVPGTVRECDGGDCSATAADEQSNDRCTEDAECPFFQACIDFHCYSDCEQDSDCRGERECYRKACRLPCITDSNDDTGGECPPGTYCASEDGQGGYCLPINPSVPEEKDNVDIIRQHIPESDFIISQKHIRFNADTSTAEVIFTNNTAFSRTITIKKTSHTEFSNGETNSVDNTPIHWLEMGETVESLSKVQALTLSIAPKGGEATLFIGGAKNPLIPHWEATLQIVSEGHPSHEINLEYFATPEGKWSGKAYYFANFGTRSLDEWLENRDDDTLLQDVGNAFIRRWGSFRKGAIDWNEFQAVLTTTQTESWRWPSIRGKCPDAHTPDPNAACYLYENNVGMAIYSDYLPNAPVPTGVNDFPVEMNLHAESPQNAPGQWTGRIVSEKSLLYSGDPAVRMTFFSNPNTCDAHTSVCRTLIESMNIEILVGGRYLTDSADTTCDHIPDGSFKHVTTPWLIPGFTGFTFEDAGQRYIHECRDTLLPYAVSESEEANMSLAASNPISDGGIRRRTLSLIDGALIDKNTLFIIFKEQFPSFLSLDDESEFDAYGYMLLRNAPANLSDSDFSGNEPDNLREAPEPQGAVCSEAVLSRLKVASVTAANANMVSEAMISGLMPHTEEEDGEDTHYEGEQDAGVMPDDTEEPVEETSSNESNTRFVHYYCEDTNLFNGGPRDNGSDNAESVPCPEGSNVAFFILTGMDHADIASHPCQTQACEPDTHDCGCRETLNTWIANDSYNIVVDPKWQCVDQSRLDCSDDRTDLRSGKDFFSEALATAIFNPIDGDINLAFRYKTKFQNRQETSDTFAPQICLPGSDQRPYCYDPEIIENIQERIDCAIDVYTRLSTHLNVDTKDRLKEFLIRNFSYSTQEGDTNSGPRQVDGFEALNAELLIMLGDESYTNAFLSRFDLVGQNMARFEGSAFEPNGIDLDGGAGFEMFKLYQAVQYYQLALERFYRLSSNLWKSMDKLSEGYSFLTPETVISWFDRLIAASSKKTRAWSEISKRYHNFNQPQLARMIIERAYTAAHLESVVLTKMMLRLIEDIPNSTHATTVHAQVETVQRTYRASMLDMLNAYEDITEDVTYFGLPPDHIPFPALYASDNNAFEKAMTHAMQRMEAAKEKEQRALEDNRGFETNTELFQAELAKVSGEYETRLAEICGTFDGQGAGGGTRTYPAISKYAEQSDVSAALGDPCGRMGNGEICEEMTAFDTANLNLEQIKLAQDHILLRISDLDVLVADQCDQIEGLSDFNVVTRDDDSINIHEEMDQFKNLLSESRRFARLAKAFSEIGGCALGHTEDCPSAAVASVAQGIIAAASQDEAVLASELNVARLQSEIAALETAKIEAETPGVCEAADIDIQFTVKSLVREVKKLQLETVKVAYSIKLALSKIQKLKNEAIRLSEEIDEAKELMVNAEAARQDPNIRLYRNDAVINADRTFYDALQQAYKATKIYEYYTSQSYGDMDQLHYIRMVSYGTYNLEAYLADLTEAFWNFEELYGLPDTRVMMISLKDDILAIPSLNGDGIALSATQRTEMLRNRLKDTELLDENGYITLPFTTYLDGTSPLTANHKIINVQAEIVGSNVGDALGRIYLRQKGTGVVRDLYGEKIFYTFPEATAVVDTFFNGVKYFDVEVYVNERYRDRPLVNTQWELVINTKDETVNKDIVLSSLNDIRLFIYYTDFTGV